MVRHEKAKPQLIITGVKLKSKICKSVHDLANQFEQITSECCIALYCVADNNLRCL